MNPAPSVPDPSSKGEDSALESQEVVFPKVYLLPNLMTAGNLFCGFMSVLQIIQGGLEQSLGVTDWESRYTVALYCIFGAFVFDFLDGRLARFGGHESAFGREFDSLADIVSFGFAPALLVFKIVLAEFPNRIGWFIAFVYLVCGALRLARFNVLSAQPSKNGGKEFVGFPIPAAAGVIASITLLILDLYAQDRQMGAWKFSLPPLMLFLSFMMFSKVRYPSFKSVDWRTQHSLPKFLGIVLILFLVIIYSRWALAVLFVGYLLYGFLRPLLSLRFRAAVEPDDSGPELPPMPPNER
jgi:CDP-diacylglycerol--serine O-phosphatidyltransferase